VREMVANCSGPIFGHSKEQLRLPENLSQGVT
jgi:hypothetical protein